jgi:glycosyltransferase involved in cell wall biosynthesis
MRVVQAVGWYFPDSSGGTEFYVAAVAREMARKGIDVCIAAPAPGARAAAEYEHNGIPVFRYPIPARPTRAEARGEGPVRGAESFHRWLRDRRPDIVHVHTLITGLDFQEILQARQTGARVIVTAHSSALGYVCLRGTLMRWGTTPCDGLVRRRRCAACALDHRGVPRVLARAAAAVPLAVARAVDRIDHPLGTALGLPAYIDRRIERQRKLFDCVEVVFVLTDVARRILLDNGAPVGKVRVNRLGIDADVVGRGGARRATSQPVRLGYLGRMDVIKGIGDLVRAVRSLEPEVPICLEIRGITNDPRAEAIRRCCEIAAREDRRIVVGGAVARGEVHAQLRSWDVLCCPSVAFEGGPTVALEAMAVGTPVIGTRIGGLAEIVDHDRSGYLVPPGDWRALARTIRRIAEHPEIVDRWRDALPPIRTMQDVADEYCAAYDATRVTSGA